jgi:hypothetical protein
MVEKMTREEGRVLEKPRRRGKKGGKRRERCLPVMA